MLIDDINNLLQDFNILNFLMILKEGLNISAANCIHIIENTRSFTFLTRIKLKRKIFFFGRWGVFKCYAAAEFYFWVENIGIEEEGGRGQWALYYTSPQSLTITLDLVNLDWLVSYVECSNVPTTNWNLQKGNFVRHHWGLY